MPVEVEGQKGRTKVNCVGVTSAQSFLFGITSRSLLRSIQVRDVVQTACDLRGAFGFCG